MARNRAEEALAKAEAGVDSFTRRYLAENGKVPDHNPIVRQQEQTRLKEYLESRKNRGSSRL